MPKKQPTDIISIEPLYNAISTLIEKSKQKAVSQAKSAVTLMFWQVGKRINGDILKNDRAEYGKQIIPQLALRLVQNYGKNFEEKNLRRMVQFASQFSDERIVVTLSRQLSWSHIILLFPLESTELKLAYAKEAIDQGLGVRELRRAIETKAYDRKQLANFQIASRSKIPLNTFKDPYIFDFFGLKTPYYEKDVEDAVLRELESFILELGKGFTFIERQKRIIVDNIDYHLDLLFYHRKLKRLVAIELKLGKFKAEYKGQMELYLKWLDRYERQKDENEPIGLILCAGDSREQIELLDMAKDGIMVAEYWTELPPKEMLAAKVHTLLLEARERIEARKLLEDKKP